VNETEQILPIYGGETEHHVTVMEG